MDKIKAQKEDSGKTYDHVLKYTGVFGGVQGITVFLSIIRNKFIAELLQEIGMACNDIYNHAVTLISNSTQFGISVTAVRTLSEIYEEGDKEDIEEHIKVIRSMATLTAMLGIIVCMAFSSVLSKWAFHDAQHTVSFIFLSPVAGMLAISGVEIAILKATRQLKKLAMSTMIGALSSLITTVPLYCVYGLKGIIPAILLNTFFVMAINLYFTLPMFKWKVKPFSFSILKKGEKIIQLGISFTLAGTIAAAAEMTVRSFIFEHGSPVDVGLYCSGFILTVSYAKFVFVSMDADFYPRLSAICNDVTQMNQTINRQLETCVLLVSPFLILFVLFLPFIVQILFKESFLAAVPMTMCAIFYMFFKSITTPIAYTSLAKGDSVVYFMMESIYYIVFVALIIGGYTLWGLWGCGIALSLSNLFDLLMISIYFHSRYKFRFSHESLKQCITQGAILAFGTWVAWQDSLWMKYGIGIPVMAMSFMLSFHILNKKTTFTKRLKERFVVGKKS